MDKKILECPINEMGETALLVAAGALCGAAVKLLLDAGADPNAVSLSGENALIKTFENIDSNGKALEQMKYIVKCLLEAGTNVNALRNSGWSPLMAAVCDKKIPDEIISMMISHGADISAQDQMGRNICSLALDNGNTHAVKLLAAAGADISTPDDWGDVPLHYAVRTCSTGLICDLILMGADTDAKNKWGLTPMEKLKNRSEDRYYKVINKLEKQRARQLKKEDKRETADTGFEFDI